MKSNKQLGLYVMLLNGTYELLKWNKALVAFGYRIDVMHMDEFERKFANLFELDTDETSIQDQPIHFTDEGNRPCTVYISKAFKQTVNVKYPQYIPFLEKGYVVLLKTFKKLTADSPQDHTTDEVIDHMIHTSQFCKSFINCLELTVGDHFRPGGFFAQIIEDNSSGKEKHDKHIEMPGKIEVIKNGNYFMLDFSS